MRFEEICSILESNPLEKLLHDSFLNKLKAYGVVPPGESLTDLCDAFDKYEFAQFLPKASFFVDCITDMKEHIEQYCTVYYKLLEDDRSRETFLHLLCARLFISAEEAGNAYTHYPSQYFLDDFFRFDAGEVMFDCGGYSGDTTLEFIQKCPDYKRIHLFEASHSVMERARRNLETLSADGSIIFHESAVGCVNRRVAFYDGKKLGDGHVQTMSAGEPTVPEERIDDFSDERVSTIKMDIEGYEYNALIGSAKVIQRDTPKMMICVYHHPEDLWKLPILIESINSQYKFYLRHVRKYQFYATVLYCVPTVADPSPKAEESESLRNFRLTELNRFCRVPTEEDEGAGFNGYYEYILNLTNRFSSLRQEYKDTVLQRDIRINEITETQKQELARICREAEEKQAAAIEETRREAENQRVAAVKAARQAAERKCQMDIAENAVQTEKIVVAAEEQALKTAKLYTQLTEALPEKISLVSQAIQDADAQTERKHVRKLLRFAGLGAAFRHVGLREKFRIIGVFFSRLFGGKAVVGYARFSPYYLIKNALNSARTALSGLQEKSAATESADKGFAPQSISVLPVPVCPPNADEAAVDKITCVPDVTQPKKNKRIAYFTNQIVDWNDGRPRFGGGERYLLNFANLLKEYGYEVDVFQPGFFSGKTEYYGLPVQIMKCGTAYSEFSIENAEAFYGISLDYDHVVYHLPEYSSMQMRKDALMICHGIWFDHNNYGGGIKFRQPHWMYLLMRAFNNPLRVVSVDTNSINVIRALFPHSAEKMTFVPNFVDVATFHPPVERRSNTRLHILFPRRSQVNRGSRILGDILARVPDTNVEFYWVGEGDAEDTQIILDIAKHDPRLHYEYATFDEMPDWYRKTDIAVIPTIASEGTSLSCLEAMASGCATIATNVGGLTDIVIDGLNGLCVDPTPAALAQAIRLLIADEPLRTRLQNDGRSYVQRFSLDCWKERWRGVLEEMKWIEKKDRRSPRICILTRNAIHGGVESLIAMEKEALKADVFVTGGLNNETQTCPFRYRYLRTYKELLTVLLDYDVALYHWIPDWAVQAVAVSGIFSMEFVHRVDTAECSKTVPNLVLSHSRYVLDSVRANTGRNRGLFVVPNGVNMERFKPVDNRSGKKTIGAVTSYFDTKGIDVLIHAWQKTAPSVRREYSLVLYGAGAERDRYQTMLREGDSIKLEGPTTTPEKVYDDLFLYVTAARVEGLPVSILEAMAANVPVLASDIAGHKVINQMAEAAGFDAPLQLFPSEDADALAKAMEAYLLQPYDVDTRPIVSSLFSGKAHCDGLQALVEKYYINGEPVGTEA